MKFKDPGVSRRALVIAGVAGGAVAGIAQQALAKGSGNEALVRAFLAKHAVSFDVMVNAFRDMFAPDGVLVVPGAPEIKGRDAIVAFTATLRDGGIDNTLVELHHIAVNGDVVFTERTDHLRRADGTIVLSLPSAGVMTLKNGKLVRWADYFDPNVANTIFAKTGK